MSLYLPPNGSATPDASYVGANIPGGTDGSKVPKGAIEYPQRELQNAHLASKLVPTNDDLTQLAQDISRGLWVGALTGTGDLAVATLGVVLPALKQGMRVRGVASAANTVTNPVLRVANLGTAGATVDYPIIKPDSSALAGGEIVAGRRYEYEVDGANPPNVMITGGGIASGVVPRIRLSANATVQVNAATGNDATGSLTLPFKTLQAAANWATRNLDLAGWTLTFACSGGFTAGLNINAAFTGQIDVTSVVFDLGGTATVTCADACFATYGPGSYTVQNTGLLTSNGSGATQGRCISPWRGGTIRYKNVNFGPTGPSGGYGAHVFARGGTAIMAGSVTITGGSTAHFDSDANGEISLEGPGYTINFAAAVNFTTAFAVAQDGKIYASGLTFTGTSPTGAKYYGDQWGTISVNGAGANYFPGSTAGSLAGSPAQAAYY